MLFLPALVVNKVNKKPDCTIRPASLRFQNEVPHGSP
jgi:hypothetical protein